MGTKIISQCVISIYFIRTFFEKCLPESVYIIILLDLGALKIYLKILRPNNIGVLSPYFL